MERYKYRAINEHGRPMRGVITANSEVDLYNRLQSSGLELIDCSIVGEKKGFSLNFSIEKKITLRDLIQLFIQLEQLQGAGVPLLDSLADIRDSADNNRLRDIMTDIHRAVSDGSSFSEAMALHPKVFTGLYTSLVQAGEETGDMVSSYRQLIKYLKWVDEMQSKVRKATRYPLIVTFVVLVTISVMMGFVVPQIVGFLDNLDQELPVYTTALIATADFFSTPLFHLWFFPVYGGLVVLLAPVLAFLGIKGLRETSDDIAYKIDSMLLNAPVFGPLQRKIIIARYAQTFGALFASGISVLEALKAARNTVTNVAMYEALEQVERSVKEGSSLSQSFNASGEFPTMVVRMIKVGEESGKLTPVLDQVSEFYTKDVDEAVQGLISMIEPALTGVMGGMILWIAVAVFGPIYSSFENIDF